MTKLRIEVADSIIAAARECLGTPFRHQGRTIGKGLDCVGLVRHPGIALGFYPKGTDFRAYGPFPTQGLMRKHLLQYFDQLDPKDSGPGDIMWLLAPDPQHLAIYTGTNMIHAVQTGPKRVVEHAFRHPFPGRVVGWFRYRGVE